MGVRILHTDVSNKARCETPRRVQKKTTRASFRPASITHIRYGKNGRTGLFYTVYSGKFMRRRRDGKRGSEQSDQLRFS